MTDQPHTMPWRPLGDTTVHFWLVQRMAKTCNVNTAQAVADGALKTQDWANMVQRCRSCEWTEGCQRWLDNHDTTQTAQPPESCMNAKVLETLANGKPS